MTCSLRNQQLGLIATLMAVILLAVTIGLLTVASSTTFFQTKLTNNEYRVNEAFTAAEAGLDIAYQHFIANQGSIILDANNDGYIDPYTNTAITNASQSNGSSFTATYTNPTNNDFSVITITSTGTSADGQTTRTVTQTMAIKGFLNGAPTLPVVGRGNINFGGNTRVTNTESDETVWSGGSLAFSGNAATEISTGTGSDSSGFGDDVAANDPTLNTLTGDEFFKGFFSGTKAEIKSLAHTVYTNSVNTNYDSQLNGQTGKLIWIDQSGGGTARIGGNTVVGSADAPVILVVHGNLRVVGNLQIYGVVYIIGDWDNSGGGTINIHGSAIAEGNLSITGTPNITYGSAIVGATANTIGTLSKISGSWRDF